MLLWLWFFGSEALVVVPGGGGRSGVQHQISEVHPTHVGCPRVKYTGNILHTYKKKSVLIYIYIYSCYLTIMKVSETPRLSRQGLVNNSHTRRVIRKTEMLPPWTKINRDKLRLAVPFTLCVCSKYLFRVFKVYFIFICFFYVRVVWSGNVWRVLGCPMISVLRLDAIVLTTWPLYPIASSGGLQLENPLVSRQLPFDFGPVPHSQHISRAPFRKKNIVRRWRTTIVTHEEWTKEFKFLQTFQQ